MNLSAAWMIENAYRNDTGVRDRLITEYLPFVRRIVYRMAVHLPSNVDVDDLVQAGIIGLIQSIDRYDATRDNSLATYAAFRIRGAVLCELRSRDVLSRGNRKKVREMRKAYIRLEQQLGRDAEDVEVAAELGMTAQEFEDIRRIAGTSLVSLEDMELTSGCDKENLLKQLVSGEEQDALALTRIKEIRIALASAIETLPEKEKMVISLYYADELTLKEIGEVLGVSESRVSQIHSRAVMRLRRKLIKSGIVDA
jgi:RNA polymerase sigma factor for flagellar operon FliA